MTYHASLTDLNNHLTTLEQRATAAEQALADAERHSDDRERHLWDRVLAAEAKVAAVIAALGIGDTSGLATMSDYPAEAPAEEDFFHPAFDAEFLDAEERAQRHHILRHLNYDAPDPIDLDGAISDAIGIGGLVMMSEERANCILDRLFAQYTDAMGGNYNLAQRIADFDTPDDFDWDAAIERADAALAIGEPMPTFKSFEDTDTGKLAAERFVQRVLEKINGANGKFRSFDQAWKLMDYPDRDTLVEALKTLEKDRHVRRRYNSGKAENPSSYSYAPTTDAPPVITPAPAPEPIVNGGDPERTASVSDKLAGLSGADAEAKLTEITGGTPKPAQPAKLAEPVVFPAPKVEAPAPSDLSDMMAAIERVTGQKANFAKTPEEQPKAVKLDLSDYEKHNLAYLEEIGITTALAARREALSALDTDTPNDVSIPGLIADAREYGITDEKAAYAVLDQLVADYPALITRRGREYRAVCQIAPRDDNGDTPPHIGVVGTDWDAMAAETVASLSEATVSRTTNRDERAILLGLTNEWQTVLELHKSAVAHGFSKGDQTVRNMMTRGLQNEPGVMTRSKGALAWKWQTPPDGGGKVKADDKATVAPEPAPAPLAKPWAGEWRTSESYYLDALTTEPRSFREVHRAIKIEVSEGNLNRRLRQLCDEGKATRAKGALGEYFYRLAS